MRIGVPRETAPGERRAAATPDSVKRLIKLGYELTVAPGVGVASNYSDSAYAAAGATVSDDVMSADVLLQVNPPTAEQVSQLRAGQIWISLLSPASSPEAVQALATQGVTAFALDAIPRISRAQKCDVLSSMANIAGYRAVIEAAHQFGSFMGPQMTAAGKSPPAKILVIGAGVAGLAAIGAGRAVGAEVRAFDTRLATKDQIESLGGKFLELSFEESGEGSGGYAKVMSEEFIAAEMAMFREQAREVDIVITTALIPGRKAPILWTSDMVAAMKDGSVVVDLAARNGGNCEATVPGEVVQVDGVHILGHTDLTSRLPTTASRFFAQNVVHFLDELKLNKQELNLEDQVARDPLVCRDGEVTWPPPKRPPPEPRKAPAQAAVVPVKAEEKPPTSLGANVALLALAGALGAAGLGAPTEFLQHLTVFLLSVFVGYQLIWNVTPALHTPLMAVTNAISGIIVVGGLLQVATGDVNAAAVLGAVAVLVATINIAGGFLVTQRMLAMFRR